MRLRAILRSASRRRTSRCCCMKVARRPMEIVYGSCHDDGRSSYCCCCCCCSIPNVTTVLLQFFSAPLHAQCVARLPAAADPSRADPIHFPASVGRSLSARALGRLLLSSRLGWLVNGAVNQHQPMSSGCVMENTIGVRNRNISGYSAARPKPPRRRRPQRLRRMCSRLREARRGRQP